jgi:hypothetical protein
MFSGNEGNVSVAGEPVQLPHRNDAAHGYSRNSGRRWGAIHDCPMPAVHADRWIDREHSSTIRNVCSRSFCSFDNGRSAIDGRVLIIYRRRQMRPRLMA